MPSVLNLKPEEVDTSEKRSKYTVGVIGCGQKGIFYVNAFAEAGFNVICTDADPSVVKRAAKGKTPSSQPQTEAKLKSHISRGQVSVSGDMKKAVSQSDIIVIAVGVKVDEQKKTDYSQVVNACKQVGAALPQGALVIYGAIAGLGFNEGTVKETLENTSGLKAGQSFGLAYNPILTTSKPTAELELSIAASDKTSLQAAANILKTVTKNVKEINDVKTAEVAALFAMAKQDANMALTNELAVFCENANIDYFEVLRLLNLRDPSFCPSIVEEENSDGAYLLLENAENLNVKLRLSALARQINQDMVKHAVNLTQDALHDCGKALRRARVAVLGVTNQALTTQVFVKMIEQKGAKVTVYDPAKREAADARLVKPSLSETVEGADCIVLLTVQEQFNRLNLKKLKPLMKSPSVIVDLTGTLEPQKVKTEGFIYCGLGRGTG